MLTLELPATIDEAWTEPKSSGDQAVTPLSFSTGEFYKFSITEPLQSQATNDQSVDSAVKQTLPVDYENIVDVKHRVTSPPRKGGSYVFYDQLLQYECVIKEVSSDGKSFIATMINVGEPTRAEEVAEIYSNEIPEAEHPRIKPGAVFYWIMGVQRVKGGTIINISTFQFKKFPRIKKSQLIEARKRAKAMRDFLTS